MLSDLMVRQAKATGKTYTLADSDGLSLFVAANGTKAWHFRFTWGGKRDRMSFGGYPALSLKEARELRDEARTLLAKGVNPHTDRKRKRHAIVLAGEHTFKAVYEQWLAHRKLSLEEGRQTSLAAGAMAMPYPAATSVIAMSKVLTSRSWAFGASPINRRTRACHGSLALDCAKMRGCCRSSQQGTSR